MVAGTAEIVRRTAPDTERSLEGGWALRTDPAQGLAGLAACRISAVPGVVGGRKFYTNRASERGYKHELIASEAHTLQDKTLYKET